MEINVLIYHNIFNTFFSKKKISILKNNVYICSVKDNCLTLKFTNMNKTELIAALAQKAEMTKVDAAKAFNALIEVTKEEMGKKDGKISIIGFGTFYMQQRPKRNGKNPQTGKKMVIPAKKVFKFKASKKF